MDAGAGQDLVAHQLDQVLGRQPASGLLALLRPERPNPFGQVGVVGHDHPPQARGDHLRLLGTEEGGPPEAPGLPSLERRAERVDAVLEHDEVVRLGERVRRIHVHRDPEGVLHEQDFRARRDPPLGMLQVQVVRRPFAVDVHRLRPRVADGVGHDHVRGHLQEHLVAFADVQRPQDGVEADAAGDEADGVIHADLTREGLLVAFDVRPLHERPGPNEVRHGGKAIRVRGRSAEEREVATEPVP